jgi:nucleoside-diphosphate-sugar epimerase
VTGASGFIGRHLIEALVVRGDDVRCVVRASSNVRPLDGLDVEICRTDLGDVAGLRQALTGVDRVFHVAGVTKAFRAAEFERANREAARNLLAACVGLESPPVIVLVSSLAAAGPAPADRPRTEADSPAPVSNYGRSKLAGEAAARQFANWAPISIARPPMVFGPGEHDVFAIAQSIARTGVHFVPGWRTRHYSLVHVRDLVEGLIRIADSGSRLPQAGLTPSDSATGTYFLADEATPTYAELGRMMGRVLGRDPRVIVMPPRAMYVAAGFNAVWGRLAGRPAALNLDKTREALAGSWTCNPARARRELGWQPGASLEQRLTETLAWCRRAGWI